MLKRPGGVLTTLSLGQYISNIRWNSCQTRCITLGNSVSQSTTSAIQPGNSTSDVQKKSSVSPIQPGNSAIVVQPGKLASVNQPGNSASSSQQSNSAIVVQPGKSASVNQPRNSVTSSLSVCRFRKMPSKNPSPFTIGSFDAYGFDIDMTIAVNNVPLVFRTVHEGMASYMVKVKGYDAELLEPFEAHRDFCTRCIVFDCTKGNFLKLDKDGVILRASHGTKFLNIEEIKTEYKDGRVADMTSTLLKSWENIVGKCMIYDNFYDMIGSVTMARMVDSVDKKKGRRLDDYLFIWDDIIGAYTHVFLYPQFEKNQGSFFPAIKENPDKFLYPVTDRVKDWLKKLKDDGKVLFLLTSSYADFAQLNANFLFGPDWKDLFDLTLTYSKKPSFFYADSSRPFLEIEGNKEGRAAEVLEQGKIYSQGNVGTLMSYISQKVGKTDPKVLYFGDSMRSDVHPAKKYANWSTVMILEEIEAEIPSVCLGNKSQAKEKPSEREVYLSSSSWGSILVDRASEATSCGGEDVNTLYSHLVYKYADLAVPSVDTVAGFRLDEELQTFDHENYARIGFYPKKPSVCH